MFIHNLKYTIKTLFKNKILVFWTFAFPIILGIFFNMAFSNIEKDEVLKVFDIAVVDNDEFETQEIYKNALKELSDNDNKDKLFIINYICLFNYLFISSQMSAKPYFIGSTGILPLW